MRTNRLDCFDHYMTHFRLEDGRVASTDGHMIFVGPSDDGVSQTASPGIEAWVRQAAVDETYRVAEVSLGDLLVWASRREFVIGPQADPPRRIVIAQPIYDACFDRLRLLDLLQPWLQRGWTATDKVLLSFVRTNTKERKTNGTMLVLRVEGDPKAIAALMAMAVDLHDAGTDRFELEAPPCMRAVPREQAELAVSALVAEASSAAHAQAADMEQIPPGGYLAYERGAVIASLHEALEKVLCAEGDELRLLEKAQPCSTAVEDIDCAST